MPEGNTIFRAARTLDRALDGKVVTRFVSVLPRVAPPDHASRGALAGVSSVSRRVFRRGSPVRLSPIQALAQLATLQSAEIVLPTTDGRAIRIRRVAKPTSAQQQLPDQLEITIPACLEWNAECRGGFAAW